MNAKLYEQSAVSLLEQIQSGRLSAEAVLRAHLARIQEKEKAIQAWAYLDPKGALEQARKVDQKLKENDFQGELAGIPIGIKDIFNTYDMPTAMGSPQWEGFTPGNDARVVHYLRLSGAVFPGKTVTAEFAVHAPGKTKNPINPKYAPGTSSSGSAAAVAAFMVPVAIGTQTAGSIVRPASYCGVMGFKPSFGLLPRTGVLKTVDTLDTVGLFARHVADLKLVFDIVRVRGNNFPVSNPILTSDAHQKKGNRPWRIAFPEKLAKKFSQPYAYEALQKFMNEIRKNSEIEVVPINLPSELDRAHQIHENIYEKSLSYYFQREFKNAKFISDIIHQMISRGKKIALKTYWKAMEEQRHLYKVMDDFLADYDAIVTLSTQGIAPKVTEDDKPDSCLIWTLCGLPVISLPLFTGPDHMPFGLQLVGRRYNDYLLLRCADFFTKMAVSNKSGISRKKTSSSELVLQS